MIDLRFRDSHGGCVCMCRLIKNDFSVIKKGSEERVTRRKMNHYEL